MKELAFSVLSLLLPALTPGARAAALESDSLRPLAVDLRRLYPRLGGRWDTIDSGDYLRMGARYRPATLILAAPGLPAAKAPTAALPRAADGVFVLRRGNVAVEQKLVGAASVPAVAEKGLLRYPGAYPHTEALYLADGGSAERFFLLADRDAPSSFSSELRVRGGKLGPEPGAGLAVFDASGAPALRFSPPRVIDAEGRVRHATLRVAGGAKGRYKVTVAFDPRGLVYPVLIQ